MKTDTQDATTRPARQKVKFLDSPKPPSCQGYEASRRNLKLWEKVKGTTVEIGRSAQPNGAWKCGTDEVFPIIDPAYYRAVGGSIDSGQTLFICKHAIAEFIKAECGHMTTSSTSEQDATRPAHTEGPFDLSMGAGGSGGMFVRDSLRRLIAGFQTTSLSDDMLPGEGEANAQLFIAAGEMKEALRRVIDSPWEPDKWRLEVETAFAKAGGQ